MHILIIDDSDAITENISLYLSEKGYMSDIAKNGAIAFEMIMHKSYDFLIVDRMMPEIDGLSLIRMLKSRSITIPFLFLTALSKQVDKIEGLSLGADDYLVKPFDLEELSLRIDNILRRKEEYSSSDIMPNTSYDITLDEDALLVKKWRQRIDLSPKEYHLFVTLFTNRGKVLDRDFLYEKVWGEYDVDEKILDTINVHIAHLRKKLWADIIRTVKLSWYIID